MMIDLTENIINCICHKREMGCLSVIHTHTFYHIIILIHYIYIFLLLYWTGTGIKILSIEINTRTFYLRCFLFRRLVGRSLLMWMCVFNSSSLAYQYFYFSCLFCVSNENVKKKNMDYNHWQESFLIYCQACVNTGVI